MSTPASRWTTSAKSASLLSAYVYSRPGDTPAAAATSLIRVPRYPAAAKVARAAATIASRRWGLRVRATHGIITE